MKAFRVIAWSIITLLVAFNIALYAISKIDVTIEYQPEQFTADKELLGHAKALGINLDYVNVSQSEDTRADNTDEAVGYFQSPNFIVVNKKADKKALVLAHEYIHYKVRKYSNLHKDKVKYHYNQHFKHYPWIQDVLSRYNCGEDCLAEESVAFGCTAIRPQDLPIEANKYCATLIPNRAYLFSY